MEIDRYELLKSLENAVKDREILVTRAQNPLTKTYQREALTAFLIVVALEKALKQNGKNIELDVCKNDGFNDGKIVIKNLDTGGKTFVELEQVMLTSKQFEKTGSKYFELINDELKRKIEEKTNHGYPNSNELVLTLFADIKGISTVDELKEYIRDYPKFMFYIYIFLKDISPLTYVIVDLQPDRKGHSEYIVEINDTFTEYKVELNQGVQYPLLKKIWLYLKTIYYKKIRK